MKSCLKCKHAVITEGLKGFAEKEKVPVSSLIKRYCLVDRNYHHVSSKCKYFFPKKFTLSLCHHTP